MGVRDEITALEEQLRQAELAPDPAFFEKHLDDAMLFVAEGKANAMKQFIVEHHQPGKGQKFTRVEMSDMNIIDHGNAAVVTCKGEFEGTAGTQSLRFMRVWCKKPDGWKIIAASMI